jgi:uncharacterized protein YndB with AHSA1/START domain
MNTESVGTNPPAENQPASQADSAPRVVSASAVIHAPAEKIFELIADPAQQPRWDGNNNLGHAEPGQRIHRVGDVFTMSLTSPGTVRENHVVEFEEGRLVAWKPAEPGQPPIGQLWRWQLEPTADGTLVTHTYDWTGLTDEHRQIRARATTSDKLMASITRLKALAEQE